MTSGRSLESDASPFSPSTNRLTGTDSAPEQQQLGHVEAHTPVLRHHPGYFFSIIVGVSCDLPSLGIEGWAVRTVLPGRMDLPGSQDALSTTNTTGSVSPEQHGSRLRWFFEPNCGAEVGDGQHEPVWSDLGVVMVRIDLRIGQGGVLRRYSCCISGSGHIVQLLLINRDPVADVLRGKYLKFSPPWV